MAAIVIVYCILALTAVITRQRGVSCAPVFKGLPVSFLVICLGAAWAKGLVDPGALFPLVLGGLVFGLAGDLLFLDKGRYFKHGIAAFLLGHVLYVLAFACSGLRPVLLPLVPAIAVFAIYSVILFTKILKKHRKYMPAALAYLLGLFAMTTCALFADARNASAGSASFFYAGALLFSLSDGVLSYRIFRRRFRLSDAIVLSTYYAAQGIIAFNAWTVSAIR